MVWACPFDVESYAELGRSVEAPRPPCPECARPTCGWSGYERHVRALTDWRIWIPRVRCGSCGATHALLPWFLLAWRWDEVKVIGRALELAAQGWGTRRIAAELARPESTVRGWLRRLRTRAGEVTTLLLKRAAGWGWPGSELPIQPLPRLLAAASTAAAAWTRRRGPAERWRVVALISGGRLLVTNTSSPLAAKTGTDSISGKSIEEVPNGP